MIVSALGGCLAAATDPGDDPDDLFLEVGRVAVLDGSLDALGFDSRPPAAAPTGLISQPPRLGLICAVEQLGCPVVSDTGHVSNTRSCLSATNLLSYNANANVSLERFARR